MSLTPTEQEELRKLKERVATLEHRQALNSGSDILQRAARTGGAIMFFIGIGREAWRAVSFWLHGPK